MKLQVNYQKIKELSGKLKLKGTKTGYPSIDNPQSQNSTFFEKNPIIPNINIYTLFKILSLKNSKKVAVDSLELKVTYEEMLKDIITISSALKELNVKEGDIVSVKMPNLYQSLIVFFACNRIGATTTYLNNESTETELYDYLNKFNSKVLFNYNNTEEDNNNIRENTNIKHIITLSKENINSRNLNNNIKNNQKTIDYNSLEKYSQKKNKIEKFHNKKETALILFTSGSTGNPKAVELTNENILAAEIYAMNTSHTENITGPKTLTCVPFSYPYGFVTSALTSILWGKETILAPRVDKNTIEYYYKKEPNIIFGSPALLDLTMKNISENQDLSFITHFISGGDFLTTSHAKRANEFFEKHGATNIEIGNGFGNAETVSIGSTPVGVPLRQETAGKILVGSTAMIIDESDMTEKKYNEEGVLCLSGKHVFKQYYDNQELTKETKFIKNGKEFYITGALGSIDEEGYFSITGRNSRFYITSSLEKVYCDRVQNIVSFYEEVKDCAIVKVPDEENLYVNKAYIVLNEQYLPTLEQEEKIKLKFNNHVITSDGKKVKLKSFEKPTYIEFVDELPRIIGSEKIDYKKLEEESLEKIKKEKQYKK